MKAITLWQPWASFMALDLKKNETRGWGTDYRGALAIAAAKIIHWDEIPPAVFQFALTRIGPCRTWSTGKILCVRELYSTVKNPEVPYDPIEAMLGFYGLGRVAWKTYLLKVFDEPILAKGKQGLWDWDGKAC
jgi:hypothetical protein